MYVLCECVYKNETFVAAALRNEIAVERFRAVSVRKSKNAWTVKLCLYFGVCRCGCRVEQVGGASRTSH